MSVMTDILRARRSIAVAFVAGGLVAWGGYAFSAAPLTISQKGREFHPAEITVKKGDTVQIVNDDADLIHHAYVDSKTFSFDSGDQEPGSTTNLTFTAVGDFNVLCAIHPKMLLVAHVR